MQQAVTGTGDVSADTCKAIIAMAEAIRGKDKCPPAVATEYAKRIVGCYRMRDLVDPQVFTMSLVALLADYHTAVVAMVADPVRGIPRKYKFPPSIAEVGDELDAARKRISTASFAANQLLGGVHGAK